MPSPERIRELRHTLTQTFLEQAQPLTQGIQKVWAKQFGESVTTGEVFGKVAKTRLLPFSTVKMRTDFRIFYALSTRLGEAFAVQHFSGATIQPTDFLFILQQNIPHAAFLCKGEGLMGTHWESSLIEKGEKDPFVEFLDALERKTGILPDKPLFHANWTYSLGKLSIEVPYTFALMPLGDGRTVFLCKLNYRPGFFKVSQTKFLFDDAFMLAEWLDEALAQFGYDGPPAPLEIPTPAQSLLALPEIAPLFDYQGEDVDWPVDLSTFNSPPVNSSRAATPPQSPKHKFCTKCGEKLVATAAFCSKCGAKQG